MLGPIDSLILTCRVILKEASFSRVRYSEELLHAMGGVKHVVTLI